MSSRSASSACRVGYKGRMAQKSSVEDLFARLAARGEDVIGRINEMPGAAKLVENANQLKERVDDLQKKVRGLDALERRVDSLEKKVDELSKASKPARKPAPKRAAAKPKS